MNRNMYIGLSLLAPWIGACSDDRTPAELLRFENATLSQGRSIWMQVCRNCHLTGVAGAPAVTDHEEWQARLAKGKEALYSNAISGISKDGVWSMPPRGGRGTLSDSEMRLAVDYMVAAQSVMREQSTK